VIPLNLKATQTITAFVNSSQSANLTSERTLDDDNGWAALCKFLVDYTHQGESYSNASVDCSTLVEADTYKVLDGNNLYIPHWFLCQSNYSVFTGTPRTYKCASPETYYENCENCTSPPALEEFYKGRKNLIESEVEQCKYTRGTRNDHGDGEVSFTTRSYFGFNIEPDLTYCPIAKGPLYDRFNEYFETPVDDSEKELAKNHPEIFVVKLLRFGSSAESVKHQCDPNTMISAGSNIKDSMYFHCMLQDYSQEVKTLIWLRYFKLVYLLQEDGFAKVANNDDEKIGCVKRSITKEFYGDEGAYGVGLYDGFSLFYTPA